MISVQCPGCGKTLKGSDTFAGRTIPCPNCKQPVTFQMLCPGVEVPSPAEHAVPIAPPPEVSVVQHNPPPPYSENLSAAQTTPFTMSNSRLLVSIAVIGGGILALLLVVVLLLLQRPASVPAAPPAEAPSAPNTKDEQATTQLPAAPAVRAKVVAYGSVELSIATMPKQFMSLPPPKEKKWVVIQLLDATGDAKRLRRSCLVPEGVAPIPVSYFGVPSENRYPSRPIELSTFSFFDLGWWSDQPIQCLVFAVPSDARKGVWIPAGGGANDEAQLDWSAPPANVASSPRTRSGISSLGNQYPELKAAKVPAPATIRDVVGCGIDGEMVCSFATGARVSIFDPETATFRVDIELPDNALVACGGCRVLAYLPDTNEFRVYDIKTGRQIGGFANRLGGKILSLAMGQCVSEQFFACWEARKPDTRKSHEGTNPDCAAIVSSSDGSVIVRLDSGRMNGDDRHWKEGAWVRAAHDLSALTSTPSSAYSSSGTRLLGFGDDGAWALSNLARGRSPATPYPGIGLLGHAGYMLAFDGTETMHFAWERLFPVPGYDLMLSINRQTDVLSLHHVGQAVPLLRFGRIPGLTFGRWVTTRDEHTYAGRNSPPETDPDRLCFYQPEKGHLIVVASDRRSLLYARQPLSDWARKTGEPIWCVQADVVSPAVAGERWSHQIKTAGCPAAPQFRVIEAPRDMSVSPDGLLTWDVPVRLATIGPVVVEVSYQGVTRRQTIRPVPSQRAESTRSAAAPIARLPGLTNHHDYLPLKGQVARTAIAGNGRYVICAILEAQQLEIIDLLESRSVAHIPWKAGEAFYPFAAGGERVVVYDRKANQLLLYDLRTGRPTGQLKNPFATPISDIAMGWKSGEAVFCVSSGMLSQLDVVQLPSGERMKMESNAGAHCGTATVRIVAGADLTVLTMVRPNSSPTGAIVIRQDGHSYELVKYDHGNWGPLYPMEGPELVGDCHTYGLDLSKHMNYSSANISPSLRPVLGAPMLLGVTSKEVLLFEKGNTVPVRTWSVMPAFDGEQFEEVLRPFYRQAGDLVFYNAELGRGFIIPIGKPGLVIVSDRSRGSADTGEKAKGPAAPGGGAGRPAAGPTTGGEAAPEPLEVTQERDKRGQSYTAVKSSAQSFLLGAGLRQLACPPSGREIYAIFENSPGIKVLNPITLKEEAEINTPRSPVNIWCDEKRIVAACTESNVVVFIDSVKRVPLRSVPLRDEPGFEPQGVLGLAPDGSILTTWRAKDGSRWEHTLYHVSPTGLCKKILKGPIEWGVYTHGGKNFLAQHGFIGAIPYGAAELLQVSDGQRGNLAGDSLFVLKHNLSHCFYTADGKHIVVSTEGLQGSRCATTYLLRPDLSGQGIELPGLAVAEVPEKNMIITWGLVDSASVIYYAERSTGNVVRRITRKRGGFPAFGSLPAADRFALYVPGHELFLWTSRPIPANGEVLSVPCGPVAGGQEARPGLIVSNAPQTEARVGSLFTFSPNFVRPEGAKTIVFRLKKGPTGMQVDAATGKIAWIPTDAYLGQYDLVLVADIDGTEMPIVAWTLEIKP